MRTAAQSGEHEDGYLKQIDRGSEVLRLLQVAGNHGRDIAAKAIETGDDRVHWPALEAGIDTLVREGRPFRLTDAIARCAALLPGRSSREYEAVATELMGGLEAWRDAVRGPAVERLLRRALLWHSAGELLMAKVSAADVLGALGEEEPERWLREFSQSYASPRTRPAPQPSHHAPLQHPSGKSNNASEPRAQTAPLGKPVVAELSRRPLNVAAMPKSIFQTWLALVALSWTSLAWSAAFTSPVGVGFVIVAFSAFGAFLVPLWATIWGFAGMARAHSRTLREIEFKDVGDDHPLAQSLQQMTQALGIPRPRIGTMPIANAFAMGSNQADATIAIGEPLMSRLMPDEIDAIIGHELGHVISGDMRRMMLMRTFQNATVWFAVVQGAKQAVRWVLCFFAELFIQRFSRKREFYADAIGAALTSKEAMIGALQAIEGYSSESSFEKTHARFMFHTPISFHWSFCSHPPIADRIAALEQETYIARLPRL